nr:tetratricopeptide repeat protein [Sporosalibacterium faouarense]
MEIRNLINRGSLGQAEKLLEQISNRNAEWHFLKGVILLRKGWHDQAINYIKRAVNMDPSNAEYRALLNNLSFRSNTYREYGHSRGYRRDPAACEICQCLICSDCCCECMGGDLIECC